MNDVPSPLMMMLAKERLRDFQRERERDTQGPNVHWTLHFPPIRRTIGLTLIRTGRVLAGAQLNGA